MSADELAFLTLGLALGIAVGAALVEVVRSRPRQAGEVRVTVSHDAVPVRAATLAGTVPPAAVGPATMGPGDRRMPPARRLDDAAEAGGWAGAGGGSPIEPYPDRTPVPSRRRFGSETAVGIPIQPTPDPTLAAINVLVASAAPAARRTALATVTEPAGDLPSVDVSRRVRPISAVLRRDPEVIARVAASVGRGPEETAHVERLLGDLADAVATRAADTGAVDPVGHGFWHEFDVTEARSVVEALAVLGFRFDLHDGFVDGVVPAQRDLSLAVAYAGLDPRRLRRWPPDREMQRLFHGASVDSERYLLGSAPGLAQYQVEALLAPHAEMLGPLFAIWDRVAPALLSES